jgi:hypothetical protein
MDDHAVVGGGVARNEPAITVWTAVQFSGCHGRELCPCSSSAPKKGHANVHVAHVLKTRWVSPDEIANKSALPP